MAQKRNVKVIIIIALIFQSLVFNFVRSSFDVATFEFSSSSADDSASSEHSDNYGLDAPFQNYLRRTFGPRRSDANDGTLRNRLGRRFDPDWMSVAQPSSLARRCPHLPHNVTQRFHRNSSALSRESRRLVASTCRSERQRHSRTCSLAYRWRNLGRNFWPQWVRDASCTRNGCDVTSSRCQADQTKTLHIFAWQCRQRTRHRKSQRRRKPRDFDEARTSQEDEFTEDSYELLQSSSEIEKRRATRQRPLRLRCRFVRTRFFVTSSCSCVRFW